MVVTNPTHLRWRCGTGNRKTGRRWWLRKGRITLPSVSKSRRKDLISVVENKAVARALYALVKWATKSRRALSVELRIS